LEFVVPHNTWFGAELIDLGYALVSCTLAPAWRKTDSFLVTQEQSDLLKKKFPDHVKVIKHLLPPQIN